MTEFEATSPENIRNPFWDVRTTAVFTHQESGTVQHVHGFYDGTNELGEHAWKYRWNPPETGIWRVRVESTLGLSGLDGSFEILVAQAPEESKGLLRAYPRQTWGFVFDNGEHFFPLGDTIYNLFGGHYTGVDVEKILRHRMAQGVNYIRARMQVSPYHPAIRNRWQQIDCWPWGGSAQWPDFTVFNLDYFRSVDRSMELLTELGIGVEVILEAWMLEFPFNDRSRFLTEHEEHWIQYIVSRYAAYPSVYVWCPANEYDLYPGRTDKKQMRESNRWFRRLAALVKSNDPFKHPVGIHQWDQDHSISELMGDCDDLDVYLVQSDWSKEIAELNRDPSLCLWIEDNLLFHVPDKNKAAMCSEFGYERAGKQFTLDAHDRMDEHHTRRGMWKAGFAGFPIVHGFNNTWGPNLTLEDDSYGSRYLLPYYRFMTVEFPFYSLSPAQELIQSDDLMSKLQSPALCLASADRTAVAIYFPVTGSVRLNVDATARYRSYWFNPRTGETTDMAQTPSLQFETPSSCDDNLLESDWVLCLRKE
jgi:hypothetical protein